MKEIYVSNDILARLTGFVLHCPLLEYVKTHNLDDADYLLKLYSKTSEPDVEKSQIIGFESSKYNDNVTLIVATYFVNSIENISRIRLSDLLGANGEYIERVEYIDELPIKNKNQIKEAH